MLASHHCIANAWHFPHQVFMIYHIWIVGHTACIFLNSFQNTFKDIAIRITHNTASCRPHTHDCYFCLFLIKHNIAHNINSNVFIDDNLITFVHYIWCTQIQRFYSTKRFCVCISTGKFVKYLLCFRYYIRFCCLSQCLKQRNIKCALHELAFRKCMRFKGSGFYKFSFGCQPLWDLNQESYLRGKRLKACCKFSQNLYREIWPEFITISWRCPMTWVNITQHVNSNLINFCCWDYRNSDLTSPAR